VSDSFQRTTLTPGHPPSGAKYAVRKSNVPLEAGEVREDPIRCRSPSRRAGRVMVIVEATLGLTTRVGNSFECSRSAAEVE